MLFRSLKGANHHVSNIREKGDKKVAGLSDDNLMFLSDVTDKFMESPKVEDTSKRIGVAEGKFVVPDDFDACNDKIAEMFGSG